MKLKIRKIGNSHGVLLPKEVVLPFLEDGFIELVAKEGDTIYDFRIDADSRIMEKYEARNKTASESE
jgi:antitoxin component of MazEF toxin-antitoxin module